MQSNMNDELSLDKIDDYKGKESKDKRKTVIYVVALCLIIGAVISGLKYSSQVSDYIGTSEAPGINTAKN